MAIELKTLNCPNCGAAVKYDSETKTATCEFCGTVFDVSEKYQEKADRERDDRQDKQIRQIMENMDRGNEPSRQNKKKSKNVAAVIAIAVALMIIGYISFSTVILSVIGHTMVALTSDESSHNETVTKPIDPFNKISIEYSGVSGAGTARISDINNSTVRTIPMTVPELTGLSNGDTFTIKYEGNSAKDYNKEYFLTETEKTYTVEGLDEFVTDITDVGEEDLQILKDHAVEAAKFTCKDDDFNYPYDEDSFEVYKVYTMVKKDLTEQQAVFIVSFNYDEEGETKTGYYIAKFEDIRKLSSGEYKIDFEAYKFFWGRDSYSFEGFNLSSGHASWDSVYTDVYLNNKAEWNIVEG